MERIRGFLPAVLLLHCLGVCLAKSLVLTLAMNFMRSMLAPVESRDSRHQTAIVYPGSPRLGLRARVTIGVHVACVSVCGIRSRCDSEPIVTCRRFPALVFVMQLLVNLLEHEYQVPLQRPWIFYVFRSIGLCKFQLCASHTDHRDFKTGSSSLHHYLRQHSEVFIRVSRSSDTSLMTEKIPITFDPILILSRRREILALLRKMRKRESHRRGIPELPEEPERGTRIKAEILDVG